VSEYRWDSDEAHLAAFRWAANQSQFLIPAFSATIWRTVAGVMVKIQDDEPFIRHLVAHVYPAAVRDPDYMGWVTYRLDKPGFVVTFTYQEGGDDVPTA
jgi:hypothetical protein